MNTIGNNIYINQNANFSSMKIGMKLGNIASQSIVSFQLFASKQDGISRVGKTPSANAFNEDEEHRREQELQKHHNSSKKGNPWI